MRISDWSSDVCSSDLESRVGYLGTVSGVVPVRAGDPTTLVCTIVGDTTFLVAGAVTPGHEHAHKVRATVGGAGGWSVAILPASLLTRSARSEEHTSELPSLMRNPSAVFCLKKKNT